MKMLLVGLAIIVSSVFINWEYAKPDPHAGVTGLGYKKEIKSLVIYLHGKDFKRLPDICEIPHTFCTTFGDKYYGNRLHAANERAED